MTPKNQKIHLTISIILIFSALIITPLQITQASTISFTCTANLYTNNEGIGQTANYILTITNTGSAKMGSANVSIPKGYSNLIPNSLQVANAPEGQTWTTSLIALPTETQEGAIQIGGSAQGLTTGQAITITFTVNNPKTVSDYLWFVCANQNTGTGGRDYDVYVITFYQTITPALITKLSCYPNTAIKAGEAIYATAQLIGTTTTATGTVTYTFYAGTYPSGFAVEQSSVAVNSGSLPEIGASLAAQPITAGSYYFLATYSGDANNPSAQATPNAFTVTPNTVSKFIFSDLPSSQIAGEQFTITITAIDIYGNTVTDYNNPVTFSSSDSQAILPPDGPLTNGVGTITFTLQISGQQTITAKDKTSPTITGTTSIYITPASVTSIMMNPKSATISIGQTLEFSVEAYDQFGNRIGDVTASSTFDAPGTTVTGNSISANTQGTYTVTAQCNGKNDTATITVIPLAPSPTPTPTTTPTPTPPPEPTNTPTPTPQPTIPPQPTPTPTTSPPTTPTPIPTQPPTPTPTVTPTTAPTTTPTPPPTATPTPTAPTPTPAPITNPTTTPNPPPNPTPTPTPTDTPTSTPTPNPSSNPTPTNTPTPPPSANPTPTPSTYPSPTSTPAPSTTPNPTSTTIPTSNTNPTINPTTTSYTLTFKEEGLPDGKLWSITLDGETKTSTTQTITFNGVSPGSHAWTINTKTTNGDSATRYLATTDDSISLKVSTTTTITVSYLTQYFLTVNSDIGNPVGQGWYDAASTAHYMVLSEYADGISEYVFTTWTGQGAGSYTGKGNIQTIIMNNPITETANWEQQTSLYSVAESFLIILLLLLLFVLLLVAWRRRKKDKEQTNKANPENKP